MSCLQTLEKPQTLQTRLGEPSGRLMRSESIRFTNEERKENYSERQKKESRLTKPSSLSLTQTNKPK